MSFSGSLGKSASDLFAELFPTGTVSLDVSQDSLSDASSAPTASSNPWPTETIAQLVPPHAPGLLAHDGSDGSPSDLDSAATGTVADASSEHAPASATFYQDPATDNDNAFYALSSDTYWSNDESVNHRLAELGAGGRDGELASTTNGSDATSTVGFDWSHFTFNDSTSAVFSNPNYRCLKPRCRQIHCRCPFLRCPRCWRQSCRDHPPTSVPVVLRTDAMPALRR
jgi:hypothetical protein